MDYPLKKLSNSLTLNGLNPNVTNINLFTQSHFDNIVNERQKTYQKRKLIIETSQGMITKQSFSPMCPKLKNYTLLLPENNNYTKRNLRQIRLKTIYGKNNNNDNNEYYAKINQKRDFYPLISQTRTIDVKSKNKKKTYIKNDDNKEIISGETLMLKLFKQKIEISKMELIKTHKQVNHTQKKLTDTFNELKRKIVRDYLIDQNQNE